MLKRRMLVGLLVLMCVGIASGLCGWLMYQEDRINDENYRILCEMSWPGELRLPEIEAVLGRPADHYGRLPSEWKSPCGTMRFWDAQNRDGWRSWVGRTKIIHALLDMGYCLTMTTLPEETIWDKVRRLCPWIKRVW